MQNDVLTMQNDRCLLFAIFNNYLALVSSFNNVFIIARCATFLSVRWRYIAKILFYASILWKLQVVKYAFNNTYHVTRSYYLARVVIRPYLLS